MVNKSYRVVSGLLATIIVLSLFLTGPTQALKLDFFIPNNYISTENPASFIATTTIETGEILDITSFTIRLIGKNIIECHFNPDGSLIGSCPILNIVQIENSEYSFGYGYLPGNLKYEITINPNTLPSGQYSTNLIANIDGNSFSSSSSEFTLIETLAESNKCSLRAKKGEAIHEGITFERKNKLSLYSPTNKASNGQGSFSTQKGRNRITYSFVYNVNIKKLIVI